MTEEIKCECGWTIKGISQSHAEANLKIHKKSKLHKRLMEIRNEYHSDRKGNGKNKIHEKRERDY